MLAPEQSLASPHYTLYLEGEINADLLAKVEDGLKANPHYHHCRNLGQLRPLQLFHIQSSAHTLYLAAEVRFGLRLGDVKPQALSRATDWSLYFTRREPVPSTVV